MYQQQQQPDYYVPIDDDDDEKDDEKDNDNDNEKKMTINAEIKTSPADLILTNDDESSRSTYV